MPQCSLIVDSVLDFLDHILNGPLDEFRGHLQVLDLGLNFDAAHQPHEVSHLELLAAFF